MKKLRTILSAAMVFCLLFANVSFAINDPYGLPTYDHTGQGETYNYSHNETDEQGNITSEGRLGASLSHELSSTSVLPGGVVVATTKATFISGQGDEADGQGALKDLLMVVYKDGNILSDYDTASPGSIPGSVNSTHIGNNESFELTTILTLPNEPGTYTYHYGVFDYGNFSGWKGALIATNSFTITVEAPTYEYKIEPTMYEVTGEGLVENPSAGQVKATLGSVDGTVIDTLSSGTATFTAEAGTKVYLDALAKSGFYFYTWQYNMNNGLEDGDANFRPNPRYVTTPDSAHTFGPTPVFVAKPNLVLTFMQEENPRPESLRRYRVFHKDGADALYPLDLGYKLAGSSEIIPIADEFGFNHDLESRFDDQFNFFTNPTDLNASETLTLYYMHNGSWFQVSTKASSTLYSITYDPNGGNLEEGSEIEFVYAGNGASTAPTPTKTGYQFMGWEYSNDINLESVNKSATATAVWEEIKIDLPKLTLTFMQEEDPTPDMLRRYRVFHKDTDDQYYPLTLGYKIAGSEEIIEIDQTFGFNHDLENRFTDQFNFLTNPTGLDASETLTLYYQHPYNESWIQIQTKASTSLYSIEYDSNGGELAEGEALDYVYWGNAAAPAPVPTRAGYLFLDWTYDTEINLDSVKTNAVATANWESLPSPQVYEYTVTLDATEGGSITPFDDTRQYPAGTRLNVTAVAADGYEFVGFTGDVDRLSGSELVVYSNISITAVFSPIEEDLGDDEGTPEENPEITPEDKPVETPDTSIEGSEDQADTVLDSDEEAMTGEDILDEETPEELGEALPDTGGLAATLFYGFGAMVAGAGVVIKRKK